MLTGLREEVFRLDGYRSAMLQYVQSGRVFVADEHRYFWNSEGVSGGGATVEGRYTVLRRDYLNDEPLSTGNTANLLVHEWLHYRRIHHTNPVNNCTVADRATIYPYGQGGCR